MCPTNLPSVPTSMPFHDTPYIRFKAFWVGLAVFFLFAVLLAVILLSNRSSSPSVEEIAAAKRYAVRAEIEAAQDANFAVKEVEQGKTAQVAPEIVFPLVGARLAASKPLAVEKPDQVVPGSPTALKAAPVAPATPKASPKTVPAVLLTPAAPVLAAPAAPVSPPVHVEPAR